MANEPNLPRDATLRDWFAAQAGQAANFAMSRMTEREAEQIGLPMPEHGDAITWAHWRSKMKAKLCYIEADAMMKAREQQS